MKKQNSKKEVIEIPDEKIDRYIKAVGVFGSRYYGDDKQLIKDLKFMDKMYDKGGRWTEGKNHAMKELFKKIFQ